LTTFPVAPKETLPRLSELEKRLGLSFPNIHAAHQRTLQLREALQKQVADLAGPNCAVVTFGSLARGEMTAKSDIDWSLLIDGQSDAQNQDHVHVIQNKIAELKGQYGFNEPNPQGAFGGMCFSQELVHVIGGEADINSKMTRRMLLLLESFALSNPHVRNRVVGCILARYLDPRHLSYKKSADDSVPRFLMNDVIRFWRTIAVDYAGKRAARADEGWALRNAKLRFSRKLLCATGMLLAFEIPLSGTRPSTDAQNSMLPLVDCLQEMTQTPPLEVVARAFQRYAADWDGAAAAAANVFTAYDMFLGTINTPDSRQKLANLAAGAAADDKLFAEVRAMPQKFQDGLSSLFLDGPSNITQLTRKYALF